MLPVRTGFLLCALLGISGIQILKAQDPRRERQIAKAESRLKTAEGKRDAAYQRLVEEYQSTEAWYLRDPSASRETPPVMKAYFEELAVLPEEYENRRVTLQETYQFHELWNEHLYRISSAARGYGRTVSDMEEAFLTLEKLRHPERFTKGFDKTPAGMVLVPAGKYQLGPATGYILGYSELQEERALRGKPFYIDKREVTCAEYARFLLSQSRGLAEEHLPLDWTLRADGTPIYPDGWALFPVTGITWVSANAYAEWVGKRLPTEEEWEIAAAGLERRKYPLGNRFRVSHVNCRANGARGPRSANQFSQDVTPLGVICMTGNVREWTANLYDEKPNRSKAVNVQRAGPYTMAVTKGGSFQDDPESCTAVFRWLEPAIGKRLKYVGFRCALDVR